MANPKHRHSKARRDKRRTHKNSCLRVFPFVLNVTNECYLIGPCLSCGYYKRVAVIAVEES